MQLSGENSRLEFDIIIHRKDDVYSQIECERSITKELNEYFSFDVPGAKFMPSFKSRLWDGKIRLFDIRNNQIYVGLSEYIYKFATAKKYTISGGVRTPLEIDNNTVISFIDGLKSTVKIRDYQLNAVQHSIRNGRCILVSPTASGKSFIIYILIRYYQQILENSHILLLVPRASLVEQMYTDFQDYGWDSEKYCHRIYAGKDKTSPKLVHISTWQSIYQLPKKHFEKYKVIIGDEVHTFAAKSLKTIMQKTTDCPYKFGLTGTLDDAESHHLVLEGLFGSVKKVTTTKALIDSKQISDLKIIGIVLTYSKKECIIRDYNKEIKFITEHPQRNNLIRNLCIDLKGNTLVLFSLIKHGQLLHELIKEKANVDRKTFFVFGGTDSDTRENIRRIVETERDAIVVASFGVFSTGINIRNLHNIIFSSPYKSRIRNLQSIGRGLRTHESKAGAKLYDIADNFNNNNHTIKHFIKRIGIYNQEEFDYEIIKINLK
jgi:superfamily II DNA or RNA helicase